LQNSPLWPTMPNGVETVVDTTNVGYIGISFNIINLPKSTICSIHSAREVPVVEYSEINLAGA